VDSNNRITIICRYTSNSRKANNSREAKTAVKPKTAGTSITAGTASARNVWKHYSRKDHNVRREGSNISNSNHSRASRDETTAVRTHQQQDRQQHKKQLEQRGMPTTAGYANNIRGRQQQQGTPTTAGMPKPKETSVEEGMLTTVGTPQQELQ
jgi:hypothetical protein